jgi:peptidoglycan pentaglycine glycine transferase (the first glycine)
MGEKNPALYGVLSRCGWFLFGRAIIMLVTYVGSERREEWNSFLKREPSFGLLQSWEWGGFKEKLGWKAFRLAVEEQGQIVAGAQMLIKPFPMKLGSVAYIPRGPIGNWLDNEIASQLLSELHRVSRRHRAIFLKIEPPLLNDPAIDCKLQQHQFRPSIYTNQPRATIYVDLTQNVDDILRKMRKGTRYNINHSVRKGVTVREGSREDLGAFHDLMRITGRRAQFSTRSRFYYEHEWQTFANDKQVALFMAFYQDQLLAVHMAYYFGRHAAYFHGGSSTEYAELWPNHLLVWEAIKWAKAQGCHTYDLWGIPDEVGQAISSGKERPVSDRTDGLWGVYRFKDGFSKNIVYYMGAYDYIYRPLLYKLITNKLFNTNTLERIMAWMDGLKHT